MFLLLGRLHDPQGPNLALVGDEEKTAGEVKPQVHDFHHPLTCTTPPSFWASSPIELQVSSQNFTGNSKIQKEEEDSKK